MWRVHDGLCVYMHVDTLLYLTISRSDYDMFKLFWKSFFELLTSNWEVSENMSINLKEKLKTLDCILYNLTNIYRVFFKFIFSINLFIYLFIYLWLCWVFIAVCGLCLVAVSGGYSSLQCAGFSLWCAGFSLKWLLLLRTRGSRCVDVSSCGSHSGSRTQAQ